MEQFIKKLITILFFISCGISHANILVDEVEVSSATQTVSIAGFNDPIIILGIPSFNEADAGVASISNVTSTSFDIKFKEWPYLDGLHNTETVPYLIIERGRHLLNDGSIWEAESFTQNKGNKQILFQESFVHAPKLLLTSQTQNETDAFTSRAWSVTNQSFSSNLSEQENGNDHVNEVIGYLAVYSSANNGNLDDGYQYTLESESINQAGFTNAFGTISLQEEQSKDTELSHFLEVISILTISNLTFATDNTMYADDTMSLRIEPSSISELVLEQGEVTGPNSNIALVGTNGLSSNNFTASTTYSLDSPTGAFDGYNSSTLINNDATGKVNRGIWLTLSGNQNQWIQVDFTKQAYITGFGLFLYSGASDPGMGVKDVTLQVSDDNINFYDHESFTIPKTLEHYVTLEQPVIGRYIRLYIHNNHGHSYLDIGELEYYGSFVVSSGNTPPDPTPLHNATCQTIKDAQPLSASGIYQIDPDGDNGLASFDAYCEMDKRGGGWTLVAHHSDGLNAITESEVIDLSTYSVLPQSKWQSIRNSMTTGMMFVDENQKITTISKSNLINGNCQSISSTDSLSSPPIPYDIGLIWQSEASGCSLSGLDYSFISLSIKSTSRGSGYLTIGAALYQHHTGFDIWPYTDTRYSGAEQDQLLYYVK